MPMSLEVSSFSFTVSQRSRHARVELRASKRYVVVSRSQSGPDVGDLPVDAQR
jgi:hypothetical protein